VYVWAASLDGALFGWYSSDPADEPVLRHDAAVRAAIGTVGSLRAPPILSRGARWRLEPDVAAGRVDRGLAADALASAVGVLARLELPAPPSAGRAVESRFTRLRRRTLIARSPLPLHDLVAAGRVIVRSELVAETSHGAFYPGHVFPAPDGVWVIDWEELANRPAGWDLLHFLTYLQGRDDRERLFEATLDLVGREYRAELLKLRYAALVKTIARSFGRPNPRFREPQRARSLLAELPRFRSEAGVGTRRRSRNRVSQSRSPYQGFWKH
jgi:hypothetical protein